MEQKTRAIAIRIASSAADKYAKSIALLFKSDKMMGQPSSSGQSLIQGFLPDR